MTSPRSMFTEAIEDHLALKKQNGHLNAVMPVTRFDVGDPLDRYPGGPVRPALGGIEEQPMIGAIASTTQAYEGEYRRPLEPLKGMTPMLSLVEDLDDLDSLSPDQPTQLMGAVDVDATGQHQVVRFPGGAGPREDADVVSSFATDAPAYDESSFAAHDEATGEQPVIVIDVDEPLAPASSSAQRFTEPGAPRESRRNSGASSAASLFGKLRRHKKDADEPAGQGWFSGTPKDFTWDD